MKTISRKIWFGGLAVLCLIFSASPDVGLPSGYMTMSELLRTSRIPVSHAIYPVSNSWSTYRLKRRVRASEALTRSSPDEKESTRAPRNAAPPAPEGYERWKAVRAKLTAYEPSRRSCGSFADGKTSTGDNAWKMDGVAVEPRAIPYGTRIWIPDVGFREADDTGSAMKASWEKRGEHHIDIRMTYIYQARNWGVQHDTVYLYRPVSSENEPSLPR